MQNKIIIPAGKLAMDYVKAKREALKQSLLQGKKVTIKPDGKVSEGDGSGINIPTGKLAMDDAALKAKREALKQSLLQGKKVTIKPDGKVSEGDGSGINIPIGKLAMDDAALKAKREALKQSLLQGKKVSIKPDGKVSEGEDGLGMYIPKGTLASQWYENNPSLLEAEKMAMEKFFPGFKLDKLDDGRLFWIGELCPGIFETKFGAKKAYTVMAVYNNNHPEQVMGSSVRIYPVLPDIDDIINECGFRPYHLLQDSNENLYLCTNEASNVKTGSTTTSAASVLAWAVKWLSCYELVLTGDLDKDVFNRHGGV